MHYEGEKL